MLTRLLRGIRSKDSAITARTPSSSVPLAAQSRDDPDPYSLPAMTIQRHPRLAVLHRGVVDRHQLAARLISVHPPSIPDASWLRSRTLANVPRIMTS